MNLLAKSCLSPGIIALVGNLIKSSGDNNCEEFTKKWIK